MTAFFCSSMSENNWDRIQSRNEDQPEKPGEIRKKHIIPFHLWVTHREARYATPGFHEVVSVDKGGRCPDPSQIRKSSGTVRRRKVLAARFSWHMDRKCFPRALSGPHKPEPDRGSRNGFYRREKTLHLPGMHPPPRLIRTEFLLITAPAAGSDAVSPAVGR